MKVKIYTDSIDYLSTNLLILPFFSDVRPLKGTLGIVDWRLNGFLSRLIINDKIQGNYFEKILIPPFERIPAERVLMVSIGKKDEIDSQRMVDFTFRLMETIYKISISGFVMSLPVEIEHLQFGKVLIENYFKGVDRFAVKVGPCDFLDNLRITFALDRERHPSIIEFLSKYLSSRSVASQALVNA